VHPQEAKRSRGCDYDHVNQKFACSLTADYLFYGAKYSSYRTIVKLTRLYCPNVILLNCISAFNFQHGSGTV